MMFDSGDEIAIYCQAAVRTGSGLTWKLSRCQVAEPFMSGEADPEIEAKIQARQNAKKAKNFAEADRIRDELKAAGIEVTDIPHGAKWKRL